MDILKLVAFGLAAVFLITFVGEQDKTYAKLIRVVVSAMFLILIIPKLGVVQGQIMELTQKIQLQDTYILTVLKVIGVAYIAEFGYQLCKDAGEESIANKIQLAGKVIILIMALPVAGALVDMIMQLV